MPDNETKGAGTGTGTGTTAKLGDAYTNLPAVYQKKAFDEQAYINSYTTPTDGTKLKRRDIRRTNRFFKSDAGQKVISDARAAHNASEESTWQASWDQRTQAIQAEHNRRIQAVRDEWAANRAKWDAEVAAAEAAASSSTGSGSGSGSGTSLKPRIDWAKRATDNGFTGMDEVKAWQAANGLAVDGKFGDDSAAFYKANGLGKYTRPGSDAPISEAEQWAQHLRGLGYAETVLDDGTSSFTNNGITYYNNGRMMNADGTMGNYWYKHLPYASTKTKTTTTPTQVAHPTYQQVLDMANYRKPHRMTHHVTIDGKQYPIIVTTGLGLHTSNLENDHSYAYDAETGRMIKLDEDWTGAPKYANGKIATIGDWQPLVRFKKQGGTMNRINYFQQGGAAPQQDMQQQVIALVQAAMQGDQKATETVNQIMEAAKAGDQQALQLAQMIQEVAKQMQGQATAAKYGAKLNYLQSLKCGGKTKKKAKKQTGGNLCPDCDSKMVSKAEKGTVAGAGFYRNWSEGDIRKLQMFLSRTDMLGEDAYDGDFDGKIGPKTIAAVKAYQKKHKLTADGMWGYNTNSIHRVVSSDILKKGSYSPSHKTEMGDLHTVTDFTHARMQDLPMKNVQEAINYYMSYPELLFSDDPKHAKWRQVFHNSGTEGAQFIESVYGALLPEEREKVNKEFKKLPYSVRIDNMQDHVKEGMEDFSKSFLPVLAAPYAGAMGLTALTGAAGWAGVTGLAGSLYGAYKGREIGAGIGRAYGERHQDELYNDPVAARYGVASAVHDPSRRIREAEQAGGIAGSIGGGVFGGAIGSTAGAGLQANYYNVLGNGRAALGYKGTPGVATPSAAPYGTTTPPAVQGVSNWQMFKAGLTPAQVKLGQTRLGGTYGTRFYHNGKVYNAGTPASAETVSAASAYYNNPASPIRLNFGGNYNTTPGVKIGRVYDVNYGAAANFGSQFGPIASVVETIDNGTELPPPPPPTNSSKADERREARRDRREARHKRLIERTAQSETD